MFRSIKLFPLETILFVKPYLAIENKTPNRHLISHIIVIKKQPTICMAIFSPEWKRNSPVHLKSPCCLSAWDRVAYYVRNRIFHKFWCCRDVFCVSQGMSTRSLWLRSKKGCGFWSKKFRVPRSKQFYSE